jgi:hypothetical protein
MLRGRTYYRLRNGPHNILKAELINSTQRAAMKYLCWLGFTSGWNAGGLDILEELPSLRSTQSTRSIISFSP